MNNSGFRTFLLRLIANRLLQHLVFWVVAFKILLSIFTSSSEAGKIDFIYTLIFLGTLALPVYLNLYFLIPRWLSGKHYLIYFFLLTLLIAVFVVVNDQTFDRWIDIVLPDYYFISYFDYGDLVLFFISFLAVTSLLKLSKAWFNLYETRQHLAEAEKERKHAELMALKSQINPHFLFNSLNNIYSLALKKSDLAPEAIVRLGNIMRYVIYQSNAEFVKLGDELELLREYIAMQRLRSGKKAQINVETAVADTDLMIAPLLFLPLVENAFKHGIKGATGESYLNIRIETQEHDLNFTIENNKGYSDKVEKEEYHGLGLENVRRRLELVYPERHIFLVTDNNVNFRVEIKLSLHK